MDNKDWEIARLKTEVEKMQRISAEQELQAQKMRDIRSRLDTQVELFTRIHHFSQRAFHVKEAGAFYEIAAEGVVDVFQLEVGAIFILDISGETATLAGACNLAEGHCGQILSVNKAWLARGAHWAFGKHTAIVPGEGDPDAPWAVYAPAHIIYMPIFDNELSLKVFVLGMITRPGKMFYDFYPQEIASAFTVYCQQMNGIYNNIEAVGQARHAMNAKNRFFANLSHEMRTPLNAIIGMTQVAQRSREPAQYEKCIEQIGVSSRHLLGLINDVLDFSKIEEGKMTLEDRLFDLDPLLEDLLNQFGVSAKEKGIRLEAEKRLGHSLFTGDATRLSQVLMNLISNAVKFTPAGGRVTLSADETSRQPDKTVVRFAVRDSGIGIAPEFQDRLFKPFEQEDSSTSRKYGGTGLGLAISQRIVELMGGSIKIESVPGLGAFFYFSIVLGTVSEATAETEADTPAADVSDFSDHKVLLVDDVEINREIVISLLEDTGVGIDCAENGRQAVERVARSRPGYYSLIFMDIQMPVMDGLEAARAIRALERPDAKSLPIIAMTANAFKEDVTGAVNAGMDGHISKPVQYEAIISALAQAVSKQVGFKATARQP